MAPPISARGDRRQAPQTALRRTTRGFAVDRPDFADFRPGSAWPPGYSPGIFRRKRTMHIGTWATACLLLGLSAVSAAAEGPAYLFGSIGPAKVSAIMTREADGTLSGWYLYLARGKQIRLSGRVEAKGAFHLEEFADDIKTGVLDGTIDAGAWTGSWRKPDGQGTPLALSLREASAKDL